MGSDDHHDHGPHRSDDPRYTETWYWNLVDPETRCVVTLHCSWLPALGRGQHTMGVLTPQGTRRERVDTTSPKWQASTSSSRGPARAFVRR